VPKPSRRVVPVYNHECEMHIADCRRRIEEIERKRRNAKQTRTKEANKALLKIKTDLEGLITYWENRAVGLAKSAEQYAKAVASRAVDKGALDELSADFATGTRIAQLLERVFKDHEKTGDVLREMGIGASWTPEDAAVALHPHVVDALAVAAGGFDAAEVARAIRGMFDTMMRSPNYDVAVDPTSFPYIPNYVQAALVALKLGARGEMLTTAHLVPFLKLTPAFRAAGARSTPTKHGYLWRCTFAGLPVMLRSPQVAADALADSAMLLVTVYDPRKIDTTEGMRVMHLRLFSGVPRATWAARCVEMIGKVDGARVRGPDASVREVDEMFARASGGDGRE